MIYKKNLTEDLRLRLSEVDMNFLRSLSARRCVSVSECIRSIIGEYRRSLESLETLSEALQVMKQGKDGMLSHGDTKTDKHDLL